MEVEGNGGENGGPFQPGSCVVLIGGTKRGKTTTMNIYTGNNAKTGEQADPTTTKTQLYKDILPQHQPKKTGFCCFGNKAEGSYPVWLDTIGLHEARSNVATLTNNQLAQDYVRVLHKNGIDHVHAVIWCLTPELGKVDCLREEAEIIQTLLGKGNDVITNIILLVNQPLHRDRRDVQGALECLRDLREPRVDCTIVEENMVIGNDLQQIPEEQARARIHEALLKIHQPTNLNWEYSACLDCSEEAEHRLFSNKCHTTSVPKDKFSGKLFSFVKCCCFCFTWKKTVCDKCKKRWPKIKENGNNQIIQVKRRSKPCSQINDLENLPVGQPDIGYRKNHNLRQLDEKGQEKFRKKRLDDYKKIRAEVSSKDKGNGQVVYRKGPATTPNPPSSATPAQDEPVVSNEGHTVVMPVASGRMSVSNEGHTEVMPVASGGMSMMKGCLERKCLLKGGKKPKRFGNGWDRFWIEVSDSTMTYFEKKRTGNNTGNRQCYSKNPWKKISISRWNVRIDDDCCFQLESPDNDTYKLRAESETKAREWLQWLETAITKDTSALS